MFNAEFAKTNTDFINACEAAGIPATARQAGKFRRGDGVAYRLSTNSRKAKVAAAEARTAAEAMTCKALRAALGLKASNRARKAELVAAYLAR
tara:strand:+ start:173 stop:451 length:279 start_codon:yes stop_codon:yes gene_type:complete